MKKSRNTRSFLCGMLAATLLSGLVGTAMAANLVNKELYYNDIKVRLNGKTLNPTDANGNKVEPFVIDGTTYLPIRAVGEALGLNVSWDGATSTVILGNDPEFKQPAAWLGEMTTFEGDASESVAEKVGLFAGTANDGSQYERVYTPSTEVSYLLKGQYKEFTGTFFLAEAYKNGNHGSDSYSVAQIQVYVDDVLVFTSKKMMPGELPEEFSIDVTNGYKLEIKYIDSFHSFHAWGKTYCTPIANAALWTD